jgi:hypothetical protein
MPRVASQVDRSELPLEQRVAALEAKVDKHEQDIADIMNGEKVRDDRLKTDTQSTISSAAVMMTTQGAMLREHDAILKELRDTSRESAKEREKRVERDKDAAEAKAAEERRESRKFWLALLALLVPVVTACIYVMAHVTPPATEPAHDTTSHKE